MAGRRRNRGGICTVFSGARGTCVRIIYQVVGIPAGRRLCSNASQFLLSQLRKPAAAAGAYYQTMTATQAKPSPTAALRILLVDSNPHDADLARTLFQVYLPCQITVVATAAAFTEALAHRAPDLILAAANLSDFSGLAALEQTVKNHPAVPFVFYTGQPSPLLKQEALARGARDCIAKDDVLGLIAVIRRFCPNPAST
jgi:CheY-like chemotaxis protein